jgi:hypothetical protein
MNIRHLNQVWLLPVEEVTHRTELRDKRRAAQLAAEPEPLYFDMDGHCWRCGHQTHNEDRTCDFCLLEVMR